MMKDVNNQKRELSISLKKEFDDKIQEKDALIEDLNGQISQLQKKLRNEIETKKRDASHQR